MKSPFRKLFRSLIPKSLPSDKDVWRSLATSRLDLARLQTERGAFWVSPTDQSIAMLLFRHGRFDDDTFDALCRLLSEKGLTDMTFLDIGANIGTHSVYALKSGLFQRALGFEPAPSTYDLLEMNIKENGLETQAVAFNVALGPEDGIAEMELGAGKPGDNRIRAGKPTGPELNDESKRQTIQVPMRRLDDILREEAVDMARCFPHLDVQGFEGLVLSGADELLAKCPALYAEFWPYGLRRAGCMDAFIESVTAHFTSFLSIRRPDQGPYPMSHIHKLDMSDLIEDDLLFFK